MSIAYSMLPPGLLSKRKTGLDCAASAVVLQAYRDTLIVAGKKFLPGWNLLDLETVYRGKAPVRIADVRRQDLT